jgi:hypothetical protein
VLPEDSARAGAPAIARTPPRGVPARDAGFCPSLHGAPMPIPGVGVRAFRLPPGAGGVGALGLLPRDGGLAVAALPPDEALGAPGAPSGKVTLRGRLLLICTLVLRLC